GPALLVIGIILFFNYVFLIIGGIVLSGGIPLVIIGNKLKLAKAFTTTRYPRYSRPVMTKFDVEVPVFYEHRGYFVAVHCWSCLKEHHIPFFIVSKDILARIHERARQWRFPEHKEAPTDDELAGIGVWAANRFLQSFRLDDVARMPVGVAWPLRTIVRPGATGRRSGDLQPTPAWFLGDRKAGTEFIEQDAFLDEIESVAKEKFRQYLVD
ncbi:MAG: hypothetical protein GYA24_22960, partial [Candidatus Lokiarchaeota archaeon]|nr:hypothetical protein [Candidatus Lokiarchaeota archaeon]